MNLTPLNSNNRPFFTTKSFKRKPTTNQQLFNNDQYNAGNSPYQNSNSFLTSSKTYQNNEVNSNFDFNNYGTTVPSGYTKESDQYSSNRNMGYSYSYNTDDCTNQTVNASRQNNSNYSTFGQFRKFYANRQEIPKQPQDQVVVTPLLFLGKDPSYPDQLNNLMKPFFCALCNARLNSIKSANIHYESKAHDRHITTWIKKTYPIDPPNLQRFVTELNTEPPGAYRCELCQLELSSAQHALQHYNGRRHRQAASKVSPPTGIGYFNVEGKWVQTGKVLDKETGKETSYILVQTSSGFEPVVLHVSPNPTIGAKRQAENNMEKNNEPAAKKLNIDINDAKEKQSNSDLSKVQHQLTPVNMTLDNVAATIPMNVAQEPQQTAQTAEQALESRQCNICGIATTSADQMLLHLKGQRHSKKLRALGELPFSMNCLGSTATILECLNSNDPQDISIYRTPSGSYYCKLCNVAVESVSQMRAHISSKKHLTAVKNDASTVTKGK